MQPERKNPLSLIEPVFVGFAGRMGSGKTSAATYLAQKHGFQYRRYSETLKKLSSQEDMEKIDLQRLGWAVMSGGRQAELNRRLIAEIDASKSAAIDGLRHRTDFDSLLLAFADAFQMIYLDADAQCRFERLRPRFANFEEFSAADNHPVEEQIDALRPRANVVIANEGPPALLYSQLELWLGRCR